MSILERIEAILAAEARAIAEVRVTPGFEAAVRALLRREGRIITTGMGKAGHVARKVASTLCSTGSPALYLHPAEAAHGDLGCIAPGDCILAFSTSGKTLEVLETLRRARGLSSGVVIGVTSHPDSELRTLSDIVLDMGAIDEPGHLGLAPAASTAVMVAIGDALALVLSEVQGFTRTDFGARHHGGYLGSVSR